MKALFILAVLAASFGVAQTDSTQPGKGGTPAERSMAPPAFLANATRANLAEIQLGQLAQKNASSPLVKQDGERMVTDHTMLQDQVKQLAGQLVITLPTSPSAKQKTQYRRLESKTGADFDKAYVQDMIRDHKQDIAEFQKEINSTNNSDVKALAQKALPVIQEHLQLWETAAKQLGIPTSSTTGD